MLANQNQKANHSDRKSSIETCADFISAWLLLQLVDVPPIAATLCLLASVTLLDGAALHQLFGSSLDANTPRHASTDQTDSIPSHTSQSSFDAHLDAGSVSSLLVPLGSSILERCLSSVGADTRLQMVC